MNLHVVRPYASHRIFISIHRNIKILTKFHRSVEKTGRRFVVRRDFVPKSAELLAKTMLDGLIDSAMLRLLPYQQRLSRVVEGTGPTTPQQPGATAKVLIPAQWGEIRSSIDRPPVVEDSTPKLKSN